MNYNYSRFMLTAAVIHSCQDLRPVYVRSPPLSPLCPSFSLPLPHDQLGSGEHSNLSHFDDFDLCCTGTKLWPPEILHDIQPEKEPCFAIQYDQFARNLLLFM